MLQYRDRLSKGAPLYEPSAPEELARRERGWNNDFSPVSIVCQLGRDAPPMPRAREYRHGPHYRHPVRPKPSSKTPSLSTTVDSRWFFHSRHWTGEAHAGRVNEVHGPLYVVVKGYEGDAYEPNRHFELPKGAKVRVVHKDESGWWYGTLVGGTVWRKRVGESGRFPSQCVRALR